MGYESRAEVIRTLLGTEPSRISAAVELIEDDVVEDVAGRTAARVVDELEGRLR